MRLFGMAKAKTTPKDAIVKLRESLEMLEKREKYLGAKIENELKIAKANATKNKKLALMALKRKKVYETQVDKIMGSRMTLETQMIAIESANVNLETMSAMKAGAEAMKALHGDFNIEKVESTMDDIRDQMEIANELSDAISQPVNFGTEIDEDELNAELELLEQESLDAKLLDTGLGAGLSAAPSVPSTIPAAIAQAPRPQREQVEEEDPELAELKASMAIKSTTNRIIKPATAFFYRSINDIKASTMRLFNAVVLATNISPPVAVAAIKSTTSNSSPAPIRLTPTEERICALLVAVAEELSATRASIAPPITLRIAGGWVRDKLLGLESHDLDIALDSLMGFEFAQAVNAYLVAHPRVYSSDTDTFADHLIHTVAKIDSNPGKSKHLETATTKLYGQLIDFVNLRTETYNDDSRVPIAEFGTPLQDALRRDITINALFYNLHTRSVEDFTNQGIADLARGHIRTPLPPLQTFIDDPLRILRVIRFASRFAFSIEPEIIKVCTESESVRVALGTKISRERIGVEVDKMLRHSGSPSHNDSEPTVSNNNSNADNESESEINSSRLLRLLRAVRLIHEFGIAHQVFVQPAADLQYFGPLACGSVVLPDGASAQLIQQMERNSKIDSIAKSLASVHNLPDVINGKKKGKSRKISNINNNSGVVEQELLPLSPLNTFEILKLDSSSQRSMLEVAGGVAEVDLEAGLRVAEALTALLMGLSKEDLCRMAPGLLSSQKNSMFCEDDLRILYLCAMIAPFMGRLYLEKKKNVMPTAKYIVMNSLKLSAVEADYVASILAFIPQIQSTVKKIYDEKQMTDNSVPSITSRKTLGLFVRELGIRSIYSACRPLNAKYVLAVFMAMSIEVSHIISRARLAGEIEAIEIENDMQSIVSKYGAFWNSVVDEHGVQNAWQLKPLINGGEVCKFFGIKAGPPVKRVLDMMIEYQLENLTADKDKVLEWMSKLDPLVWCR
ncbi:CCA tRNA nucleotidyltransferase, mitochondrial [Physocladia obscura]|uniref:CCA tRNA nucleotidyltransferase, mitochondrial n=1 Tax=Physocladia obscura TaxID=109957 RepID=A0AAD5XCD8_9FUNG|nr:CCA tRNA nucleotidyltransferase, mitochondrial [Physocladia obscura]